MTNTGLRVGEITGLRWEDIDLDQGMIEVNHTLVYYDHAEGGCYFSVHTPKTKAGNRTIPMLEDVKEAFMEEKHFQEMNNLKCNAVVDGYTDFIFINRFGNLQHQGTLNKALRRITMIHSLQKMRKTLCCCRGSVVTACGIRLQQGWWKPG